MENENPIKAMTYDGPMHKEYPKLYTIPQCRRQTSIYCVRASTYLLRLPKEGDLGGLGGSLSGTGLALARGCTEPIGLSQARGDSCVIVVLTKAI